MDDAGPDEAAIIGAGVRALGWGDAVSHVSVLTRDVVRTTGLVRDGQRFIMKQFPAGTCLALLRERVSVLRQLARSGQPVPRMATAEPISFSGDGHAGWLVVTEYLPGDPLIRLSIEDFEDLGAKVGELHLRLREVDVGPDWAIHASCSLRVCRPGPAASHPPRGHLCHGDLHVGNVVRGTDGYAFIDFDETALGGQIEDVAALLGIPMLRRYGKQAIAILRGYAGALTDPAEADLVYGPKLLRALARRFRHLASIQWTASSGPDLVALADDLAEYASHVGAGLDGWLARGG